MSTERWMSAQHNLVRWTEMPRGGHFAAMEEPELLAEDVRSVLPAAQAILDQRGALCVRSPLHAALKAAGAPVAIAAGVQLAGQTAEPPAAAISFNRDIRPIMAETCFRCHGPDKSSRMAGMRLDLRDEALKPTRSGVVPIVPGDPEKSAIVQRIFATNARVMPPAAAHKVLTDTQKNTIKQWVAEGAKYEGHWAYQRVQRTAPSAAAPHPVDAFIRDRLAREGLKPSPEADRRTLLRRVSLDLTGIPPTPEETATFLADQSSEPTRRWSIA